MKRILFTLVLLGIIGGMSSCRKDSKDIDIKTYDEQQIQGYIKANGLTGFTRDLTGGDTSGIYYKIIQPGKGKALSYPDTVALVFTMKSFDSQYQKMDTILNHIYDFLGHVDQARYTNIPDGLQLAILNCVKNKGTTARILLPSRLAYGRNGFGSGSSESSGRVAGNESLDIYVNVVDDAPTGVTDPSGIKLTGQDTYDDKVIDSYISKNNLTGYNRTPSGLRYKVTKEGAGTPAITPFTSVDIQWTETLLNGARTGNEYNNETGTGYPFDLAIDARKGVVEGLQLVTPGAKLTLLIPSRLMYKNSKSTNLTFPPFSCIRYDINVIGITP